MVCSEKVTPWPSVFDMIRRVGAGITMGVREAGLFDFWTLTKAINLYFFCVFDFGYI